MVHERTSVMKTLINVSNRLPVTIGQKIKKSSGGLVSALEGLADMYDFRWVGWSGEAVDSRTERERISTELTQRFNFIPLFLEEQEAKHYYTGFSNSSLWPLLHYISPYERYAEEWWDAYQLVNRKFADTVAALAKPGHIIWVHDYHLMLLPSLLRERIPGGTIGFFFHTPFPPSVIFACHPNRKELLEGLMGADLIGFHTFNYLSHFRSTLLRILGLESEVDHIWHNTHKTGIGVYPIGINYEKFRQELESARYFRCLTDYQKIYADKKIILSVERLDYTKGTRRRLEAIERYLNQFGHQDDIVFIFINVPSRESVEEYQNLLEDLQSKVSRINGRYGTIRNSPIHFIHRAIDFSELCALYSLADVAMVTPLIDGMNLVAKEYIACQKDSTGMLILSEFAGAAQELPHAIIVNPYNTNEMAQAIRWALDLPDAEKKSMIDFMKERVIRFDARYWADSFIRDLTAETTNEGLPIFTKELTVQDIQSVFDARRIGLFLDYDGTIAELKRKPADALPNDEINQFFRLLESNPQVETYIISGRKKEDMDQWFAGYGFHLIAEHGYYYKRKNSGQWEISDPKADLTWKQQVLEIFQHYAGMTPGSFVEEKTSSVVWHYRNTDPEFGPWKANHLLAELNAMLSNLPVEIRHGKKIVEVTSIQISKGIIMEHLLLEKQFDAIVCAGDDETDESMFRSAIPEVISIKVGDGGTAARFRIAGPRAFRNFMKQALQRVS